MRRIALGVDAENPTGATRVYNELGCNEPTVRDLQQELRAGIELADVDEDR